jgi:hypothetical protein
MQKLAFFSIVFHLMVEQINFSIDLTARGAILRAYNQDAQAIEDLYPVFAGYELQIGEQEAYKIKAEISFETY